MTRIFFKNLYSELPTSENEALLNKFLDCLPVLEDNDLDRIDLTRPVTIQELWDAIISFKTGRVPGADGISIEFYKATFEIIKHQLLTVINNIIFDAHVPRKMNTGIIKLLYKEGDKKELKNYRPISLLNVDLKIITKIFSLRLKPILPKIVHQDQYAQPGKQIFDLNCLTRDIFDEMENGNQDCFLIKWDFHKAFDSISHKFLMKCLRKMNFPEKFINFLEKMYHNVVSKVMINGRLSKVFKVLRGARQGDPLSLYIFIIVLNAFLMFLNNNSLVVPFKSQSDKKFLKPAYADDLNLTTPSLSTVLHVIRYLEDFKKVSGLEINFNKTFGVFFNKTGLLDIQHLPLQPRNWNQNMLVLGIPYGTDQYKKCFWKEIVENIKTDISKFNKVYTTYDAKSMITKSLVLPKISYAATVFDIPRDIRKSLESMVFRYIIPKGGTHLNLMDLAQKRKFGVQYRPHCDSCKDFWFTPHF